MAWCTGCGAADQFSGFCTSCGARMAVAGRPPESSSPTVSEPALTDTVMRRESPVSLTKGPAVGAVGGFVAPTSPGGWSAQQSRAGLPGSVQPPKFGLPRNVVLPPTRPSSRAAGGRGGWLVAGGIFLAVAAVATTVVLVFAPSEGSIVDQAVVATANAPSAAPPVSGPGSTADSSSATLTRTATALTTVTVIASTAAAAPVAPAAADPVGDPMGGPHADIPCGQGYIVQVAYELHTATFVQRIADIRAVGMIPPSTKWADTSSSCSIFSSQSNVLVLYAGPFATPYDACAARLASPPDAFIKGTTAETSDNYISCLCPAVTDQLPAIVTVGQQGCGLANCSGCWEIGSNTRLVRSTRTPGSATPGDGAPTPPKRQPQ